MSEAGRVDPATGTAEQRSVTPQDVRTVVASSVIGTAVEWYDFFLFGVAAGLVLDDLYFPNDDPLIGTLLAYTTFAIGFVARPIGGLLFGHIGDRHGRKRTLVTTMLIMGGATFLMGAIPTYEQIGVAAPILLIVLRIAQGIAIGGEWGGAVLMAVEYAPPERRGFYGSFPQLGLAVGLVLGTGVFTLLSETMDDEAFRSYGWRIAFFASLVLVLVGLYIRLKVLETPAFAAVKAAEREARVPFVELVKDRRSRRHLALGMGSRWAEGVAFNTWAVFIIAYATDTLGMQRGDVLLAVMISACVMGVLIPAATVPRAGDQCRGHRLGGRGDVGCLRGSHREPGGRGLQKLVFADKDSYQNADEFAAFLTKQDELISTQLEEYGLVEE